MSRGVSIHLLRRTDARALIYVYRQSALKDTLSDPEIQSFLSAYGYDACKQVWKECGDRQVKVDAKTVMLRGYGGAQNVAAVLLRSL